ncbi:TolC family protein [Vibrio crassostreae]|uniref:TolC family protein n=1 Tax=Vibrio crassostreae TaxID=246167 RepID=UPI001B312304|nr:TolC family protein [Vibrio crassostreae]
MKPNKVLLALSSAFIGVSTVAADIDDYIQSAIRGSHKINTLIELSEIDKIAIKQEEMYYLPTVNYTFTGKNVYSTGLENEQNLTFRSTLFNENHSDILKVLGSKSAASLMDVEIQKSAIAAQTVAAVYKIKLYEELIEEGERILEDAKKINSDIKQKVDGGVAKASDSTTSEVLIKEMENNIMAIRLKIDQAKLQAEMITGIPYPEEMTVSRDDVEKVIHRVVSSDITQNKELLKKKHLLDSTRFSIDSADSLYSVSLYNKNVANSGELSGSDSEIGLELSIKLVDPASYWKKKQNTHRYKSEQYTYDQMYKDLQMQIISQANILDSNKQLWDSQDDSLKIRKNLIDERGNEYQINLTSLYELISSLNTYYSTYQQRTETEVTLVNTVLSIDVLTGEI